MKPVYQVRVWQEDGWWLARVVEVSQGADASPLNALTQARSLARIESMGRDLIATILDASEETFDVKFDFQLPGEPGECVRQAKDAHVWLDAAQDLWQERSGTAVRVLAEEGYSLRETATLLGLSHQRVDQILASHPERGNSNVLVICEGPAEAAWLRQMLPPAARDDLSALLIVVSGRLGAQTDHARGDAVDVQFINRFRAVLRDTASRLGGGGMCADLESSVPGSS